MWTLHTVHPTVHGLIPSCKVGRMNMLLQSGFILRNPHISVSSKYKGRHLCFNHATSNTVCTLNVFWLIYTDELCSLF